MMVGGFIFTWTEMCLWPSIWEQDFGFAPVGMHKVEPNMVWYFNDNSVEEKSIKWTQTEMHKLYDAQIAAAISRVMKLGFTVQFRGPNVWLHKPLVGKFGGAITKLFNSESLLIRNLARMSEWLLSNNFVDPRIIATEGTSNLHMLLGKFDFA